MRGSRSWVVDPAKLAGVGDVVGGNTHTTLELLAANVSSGSGPERRGFQSFVPS